MRRFYVEISEEAFAILAEQAFEERRPVRDEAAWLLEKALRARQHDPERREKEEKWTG